MRALVTLSTGGNDPGATVLGVDFIDLSKGPIELGIQLGKAFLDLVELGIQFGKVFLELIDNLVMVGIDLVRDLVLVVGKDLIDLGIQIQLGNS